MPTASELVARGAALLDSKLPGWADQIDLDTLEMASGCRCVLGQLGRRKINLDKLGWERSPFERGVRLNGFAKLCRVIDTARTGFVTFTYRRNGSPSYDDLQDAWKQEIVARRTLDAR